MNSFLLVGLVGLVLLPLYQLAIWLYNIFLHPLAKYPGPVFMTASRIPYCWRLFKGTLNQTVHEAHKIYGEVVRIAPNELSFISGETAWQDIYGHHSPKANKGPYLKDVLFYSKPPNGVSSIIGEPSVQGHARHRRLLAHAFSDKALRAQEPLIQQYVNLFIFRLGEQCEGNDRGKVDVLKWINFTTFDVMGDLSFGESFHSLDNSNYHPFVRMIYYGAARALGFNMIMRTYPIIKKIQNALGLGVPEAKRRELFDFAVSKVEARIKTESTRPDFMTYAQKHQDEEGLGLSNDELHSDFFVMIGAGSETTATTLSGVVYNLAVHPEKLKRLQEEIRPKFNSLDEITIDAVNGLQYMIACLQEGLRFYPPVPTGFSRLVPPGGDTISGYQIPESTAVYVSQYATNHSTRNFKNPDEWIPERWLEGNKEFESDNKAATQPFSFGPRNCIGKNLAYAEMRLVMAKLVWQFDWELLPESRDWMNQKVFTLWMKPPLMVQLKPVVR